MTVWILQLIFHLSFCSEAVFTQIFTHLAFWLHIDFLDLGRELKYHLAVYNIETKQQIH